MLTGAAGAPPLSAQLTIFSIVSMAGLRIVPSFFQVFLGIFPEAAHFGQLSTFSCEFHELSATVWILATVMLLPAVQKKTGVAGAFLFRVKEKGVLTALGAKPGIFHAWLVYWPGALYVFGFDQIHDPDSA